MSNSSSEAPEVAVRYSPVFAAWLGELKSAAEAKPDGPKARIYESVVNRITLVLSQPNHAFAPKYQLRKPLAPVCRFKLGRLRVFYIGSRLLNRVILLCVGMRKEGDKRDAYIDLERRIRRAEFDQLFIELNLEKPKLPKK